MRGNLRCSFCGKNENEVEKLVAGPSVYICDTCVRIATDIIDNSPPQGPESRSSIWGERVRSFLRVVRGIFQRASATERSGTSLTKWTGNIADTLPQLAHPAIHQARGDRDAWTRAHCQYRRSHVSGSWHLRKRTGVLLRLISSCPADSQNRNGRHVCSKPPVFEQPRLG